MSTSIARVRPRPGRPARLLLPVWIVAGIMAIVATALGSSAPVELQRSGPSEPFDGELLGVLTILGIGATILLAVVRPWSYCHAWGRALVALLLWTAWTALHVVSPFTRGGPVSTAHVAWAGLTWLALLGAVVVSANATLRTRARTIPQPMRRAA